VLLKFGHCWFMIPELANVNKSYCKVLQKSLTHISLIFTDELQGFKIQHMKTKAAL